MTYLSEGWMFAVFVLFLTLFGASQSFIGNNVNPNKYIDRYIEIGVTLYDGKKTLKEKFKQLNHHIIIKLTFAE